MVLKIIRFILLAPFEVLGKILDFIFFPPKAPPSFEDENLKLKRALRLQVSNSSSLESALIQMDREHRRETKQMEEYYEKKIRDLQNELKSMRWRKGYQP